jgi:hypothetical protein
MRGRHSALLIRMNDQTRATLQGWLHRQKIPLGRAKRARAILLLEQGHTFCSLINSSRGDITSGFLPKCLAISAFESRSKNLLTSIPHTRRLGNDPVCG